MSLDGPEAVHDCIRGVPGCFSQLADGTPTVLSVKRAPMIINGNLPVAAADSGKRAASVSRNVADPRNPGNVADQMNSLQHAFFKQPNAKIAEGYQSVPVDWGIGSPRKRGFFELLERVTGSGK